MSSVYYGSLSSVSCPNEEDLEEEYFLYRPCEEEEREREYGYEMKREQGSRWNRPVCFRISLSSRVCRVL
jgi:hypothetical protein